MQAHPQWGPETQERYRAWLQTFDHFLARQGLNWRQVEDQHLQAFQQELCWSSNGRGGLQSGNTIYQGLRLLRAFYRWAAASEQIAKNPMQDWILARPATLRVQPLKPGLVLDLFNLPDLAKPAGQRDYLLLHLVYQGLSLAECQLLDIDSDVPSDPGLQSALRNYLRRGRPQLAREPNSRLLLTRNGRPYGTVEGLRQRFYRYGRLLGRPDLSARLLQYSLLEHQAELSQRRANL